MEPIQLNDAQELDPMQGARLQQAPLPTKQTLRTRNCLPLQLAKFGVFNLRMLKVFFLD